MSKILSLRKLFIGGSLASSCFSTSQDKEEHTRLTKEERIQAKKILERLNKIDAALKEAAPIAVIGILGWSLIWLYRGLCYQCVKGCVPLQCYVDKSYNVARIFGIGTMLAGGGFFSPITKVEENNEIKRN